MSEWKTVSESPLESQGPRTLDESRTFAPQRRPAYPKLTIIDDHSDDNSGEVIRIRHEALTIGRTEGDLVFPAESLMSSLHAKVSLQRVRSDRLTWVLEDMNSRNGVFLRLPEFEVAPGNEFVVGATKLRMHGESNLGRVTSAPLTAYEAFLADPKTLKRTYALELCSYSITGVARDIPIDSQGVKLGRCVPGTGLIEGDPFIEAHHATVRRSSAGGWKVTDQKSHNGLWLRVHRVVLAQPAMFLVGEQRFTITC